MELKRTLFQQLWIDHSGKKFGLKRGFGLMKHKGKIFKPMLVINRVTRLALFSGSLAFCVFSHGLLANSEILIQEDYWTGTKCLENGVPWQVPASIYK